jgi:ABC-type amino acid transport substrate-binding protein
MRPLEGITVLVVDGDLAALEVAEKALANAGARVLAAPTAEAVLRLLVANRVDVIVSDDPSVPSPSGRPAPARTELASDRGRRHPERLVARIRRIARTA